MGIWIRLFLSFSLLPSLSIAAPASALDATKLLLADWQRQLADQNLTTEYERSIELSTDNSAIRKVLGKNLGDQFCEAVSWQQLPLSLDRLARQQGLRSASLDMTAVILEWRDYFRQGGIWLCESAALFEGREQHMYRYHYLMTTEKGFGGPQLLWFVETVWH